MQVGTVVVMGADATARWPSPAAGPAAETLPLVETPPYTAGGHALSNAEFRSATGAVDHAVDARYAWDAGVAIGRFLEGLLEGRILGRECRGCERVLVPPRMFCERCFRATDAWRQVEPTGVVQTFSVCHVRWDMERLESPEVPAVISIDGSDGGLLHVLGDVSPDEVRVGMAVEAVWRPVGERTGSILDIAHFRPRPGGPSGEGEGPGGGPREEA
ncbi:MAG TPA: Zn-ribbon domain-containing OB-fold protein [Actinomycetota bacterium]